MSAKQRTGGASTKRPIHKHNEEEVPIGVCEVARQLGKSPQTITRWIKDGLLEAIRLPSGMWGVKRKTLNSILRLTPINKQVEQPCANEPKTGAR